MKEALVTGGAGFIGSHITDALVEQGYATTVIDNLSHGQAGNVNRRATFYNVDIRDQDRIHKILRDVRPDVIFHLAAQTDVASSMKDPVNDHDINVTGTLNVLSGAIRCESLDKIIFSSSAAVYGDVEPEDLPVVENQIPNPKSFYGLSKLMGERYIDLTTVTADMNSVILRYSNVFGPRQSSLSEGGVISTFVNRLLTKKPVIIDGNGNQTRDYIYIDDVVRANLAAMQFNGSDVFNVSNNNETSINELYRLIMEVLRVDTPPVHGPVRIGDISRSILSNDKALSNLSWAPTVSLVDGIRKLVDAAHY